MHIQLPLGRWQLRFDDRYRKTRGAGCLTLHSGYAKRGCARVNGLEPHAYLLHLFEELPKARTAEALEALLPWNVKPLLKTGAVDRH